VFLIESVNALHRLGARRTTKESKTMSQMNANQLDRMLQSIAAEHMCIDTLNTRHSDRLDFHEVSVWNIRAALQAAFDAGRADAASQSNNTDHNNF
jgi:hypothetical protein